MITAPSSKCLRAVFAIALSILTIPVFSQSGSTLKPDYSNSFQRIIPPAPDASSLGRYGNVPVSMHTGIPNISIPIYEVKVGDLILPISLSYHSGGVRVDEFASNVGTGWSLVADPQISRSMVGRPDEMGRGYLTAGVPTYAELINNLNDHIPFLYEVSEGSADCEQDYFTYNLLGAGGRFVINKDKSVFEIPLSDNKIILEGPPEVPPVFHIINNKGQRFVFGAKEKAEMIVPYFGTMITKEHVSTWHISNMISADEQDTIKFSYDETGGGLGVQKYSYSYSASVGGTKPELSTGPPPAIVVMKPFSGVVELDSKQSIFYYPMNVRTIHYKGGKIEFFNVMDRKDVNAYGANSASSRLVQILIYNKVGTQYTVIKKVSLKHTYFFYKPHFNDAVSFKHYRLRLDEVSITDGNGNIPPQVYKMKYDETPMEMLEGFGQDMWGFNNGVFPTVDYDHTLMPVTTIVNNSVTTFGDADRSVDTTYMKSCIIKEMEYPTKGKSVFNFEPHQYNSGSASWVAASPPNCAAFFNAPGNQQITATTQFTINKSTRDAYIKVSFSAYQNGASDRPTVSFKDLTTGGATLFLNMTPSQNTVENRPITLFDGPHL